MTARRRPTAAQNQKPSGDKNVRDPSEHPLGIADSEDATHRRRAVSGDGGMRLPFEHDETGDPQERAGGTDRLMHQAAADATSGQVDTDRRGDAVDNFDRHARQRRRRH